MKRMNRQSGETDLFQPFLVFAGCLIVFGFIVIFIAFNDAKSKKPPLTVINTPSPVTPATPETTPTPKYNMDVVTTNGDNSYIPLNLDGEPSEHIAEILGALSAFQRANHELEVISWTVEKRQHAYGTSGYIFGIWVHHKPK